MPVQPVLSAAALSTGGAVTAQPKDTTGKIQKAATDFEALLLGQLLRLARESGGGSFEDGEDSETNSSLMELGEQEFAQTLAAQGGLGIARMVTAGLDHAD